jgi:hypothetical protein
VPDWAWVLIGLLPLGVILTILWQYLQAKSDEKRRLRENGSAAITPVKEFLARIGPEAITWGTDEECKAYLAETRAKWWDAVRPPLLVYANAHPSQAIREFTNKVVEAVQKDLGDTQYLLAARRTGEASSAYEAAKQAHDDSQRLVEELLQKVRDY